jgi:hypothetical protein
MEHEVTIEELEIGETVQVSPGVVVERRCLRIGERRRPT